MRWHASGIATYPAGAAFGPRWLSDYELVWIIEGDALWMPDGVEVPAPAGTLLLARPGMHDVFRWDPQRRTRHGFIHFEMDIGNCRPAVDDWPLARVLPHHDIARPLLKHLGWLLDREEPAAQEQAIETLRLLLTAFFSNRLGLAEDDDPSEHPAIARAFSCIARAWERGGIGRLDLDHLAQAAGVSRMHLTRLFQSAFGLAPMQALRLARLERACALLARTDLAIGVIGEAVGFPDPYHFSRCFSTHLGRSPSDYRLASLRGQVLPTTALARIRSLARRMVGTGIGGS